MKNLSILLIAVACSFSFLSCEKEEDGNKMDFKLTGIRDTIAERGETIQMPMKCFYLGGKREKVTVTAGNLPAGTQISYDPVSGEPDFAFNQYITVAANADTGLFNIIITGKSESGNTFSKTFDLYIKPEGNNQPQIGLNGDAQIIHKLNTTWIDPGYIAIDQEDGDITNQVVVTGYVNEDSTGLYILTYTVVDSEGGTNTVTRNVIVQNEINYVNGQYTSITILPGGGTISWTNALAASVTVNNRFQIFKIGDYFQANPIAVYDPSNDSIYISAQTFLCPADTQDHTFQGSGYLNYNGTNVSIEINYTDTYYDSTAGNMVSLVKRDIYNK